jgi:ribosome-binding ATPase YchF (GTP1/OBG family)
MRSRTWCAASRTTTSCTSPGKVDPLADIETINTELALADLESVEKALQRAEKAAKAGDKDAIARARAAKRVREHLNQGKPARAAQLAEKSCSLRELHLLTLKPVHVRRQRAEERLHRTTRTSTPCEEARRGEGAAGGARSARPSRPRSRSSRTPTAPSS